MSDKPQWVDATAYSKRDTERVPRTYTLDIDDRQFVLTRRHLCGDEWHFLGLGYQIQALGTNDLDEAKARALDIVSAYAKRLTDAVADANKAP